MQQTLTAPTARPVVAPVVRDSGSTAPLRPSFHDRLQARRARNAPMARQILAMPATRGVGGVVTR